MVVRSGRRRCVRHDATNGVERARLAVHRTQDSGVQTITAAVVNTLEEISG